MVAGLGSGDLSRPYSTLATLKHFLAYGISESGQNGNPSFAGMRELHENFLPPFGQAINAGALSVMTSYNSMDGTPCTANHYLLTELLRDDWKFKGVVVSDLYSIEGIHQSHFVASTMKEAAVMALSAGVDIDLGGDAYMNLMDAVNRKEISKEILDAAVSRVLRLKFEMGLFENPYVDPGKAKKEVRSKEYVALARQELLKALKATGKPLIVVYIEGRPLDKNWASENADALLTAYYPGQEGGNAIADVLFGEFNPAGRLPFSVPRSVGQVPVYYNKKAPQSHDYVEMSASPLYSFGYGLSYTTFEYSDLHLSALTPHSFEVSCKIRNTGKYDGEEVVQLYLRDEYASVVQPLKQLKHFARLFLKCGEEQEVKFILSEEDFALVDRNLKRVVEPGTFQVMIGAASDDIRLQTKVEIK